MHRILIAALIVPVHAGIEPAGPDPAAGRSLPDLFGGIQSIDLETEALLSDDIDIWRSALRYSQERQAWSLDAGLSHTDYTLDYQPFARFGGTPARLDEGTWQADLTFAHQLGDSFEASLGFSGYDGFADYRSIWIAEYYRQTFNFPGSGYYPPDPHGWSVTGGLVWDPAIGTRLALDLIYGRDTIAPGWTFRTPGNDLLETRAAALRWEQALNPRLKSELSFLYNDVTDRDPRYHLQSSWAAVLTDELTLRAQLGAATEDPNFEAYYGGLSLDYQFHDDWSLTLGGRLYEDTGEIESSGFNTAAPGVKTAELGASVLYDNGDHALRLGVSFFETEYDPVSFANSFFANLYQERDWWTFRLAYSLNF